MVDAEATPCRTFGRMATISDQDLQGKLTSHDLQSDKRIMLLQYPVVHTRYKQRNEFEGSGFLKTVATQKVMFARNAIMMVY